MHALHTLYTSGFNALLWRLITVSRASLPKASLPSETSVYASSTKRTPPTALSTTRRVFGPVSPTCSPTKSTRETSTKFPPGSILREIFRLRFACRGRACRCAASRASRASRQPHHRVGILSSSAQRARARELTKWTRGSSSSAAVRAWCRDQPEGAEQLPHKPRHCRLASPRIPRKDHMHSARAIHRETHFPPLLRDCDLGTQAPARRCGIWGGFSSWGSFGPL
jgi:hypothetical protein